MLRLAEGPGGGRTRFCTGAVLVVLETCYSVTDPPLKSVHRLLPPLRIGVVSADWTVAWSRLRPVGKPSSKH